MIGAKPIWGGAELKSGGGQLPPLPHAGAGPDIEIH